MNAIAQFCIAIVIAAAAIGGFYFLSTNMMGLVISGSAITDTAGSEPVTGLDSFAQCLTDSSAKMYGADWCGHCQSQKSLFGSSFQYVTYVECNSQGPNAQPEACAAAGVQGYPTWIINGQAYPGEKTISELSSLTGCEA